MCGITKGMFTSEDDKESNWNEDSTVNSECANLGFFETVIVDSDEEKKDNSSKVCMWRPITVPSWLLYCRPAHEHRRTCVLITCTWHTVLGYMYFQRRKCKLGWGQSKVEISNIQFTILYLVRTFVFIILNLPCDTILHMFSANCNKVGHFTQDCTLRLPSQVNLNMSYFNILSYLPYFNILSTFPFGTFTGTC